VSRIQAIRDDREQRPMRDDRAVDSDGLWALSLKSASSNKGGLASRAREEGRAHKSGILPRMNPAADPRQTSSRFTNLEIDQISRNDLVGLAAAPMNKCRQVSRYAAMQGAGRIEHESAFGRGDAALGVVISSLQQVDFLTQFWCSADDLPRFAGRCYEARDDCQSVFISAKHAAEAAIFAPISPFDVVASWLPGTVVRSDLKRFGMHPWLSLQRGAWPAMFGSPDQAWCCVGQSCVGGNRTMSPSIDG